MVSLPLISFHTVVSVTLQGEEEESTLDLLEVFQSTDSTDLGLFVNFSDKPTTFLKMQTSIHDIQTSIHILSTCIIRKKKKKKRTYFLCTLFIPVLSSCVITTLSWINLHCRNERGEKSIFPDTEEPDVLPLQQTWEVSPFDSLCVSEETLLEKLKTSKKRNYRLMQRSWGSGFAGTLFLRECCSVAPHAPQPFLQASYQPQCWGGANNRGRQAFMKVE